MKGFIFGFLGKIIDTLLILALIVGLVFAIIWTVNYLNNSNQKDFLDNLKGLGENLTGHTKQLYSEALQYYENENFTAYNNTMNELHDDLVKENKTEEAEKVKQLQK